MGQAAEQPAPVLRGRRSLWRMLEYLEGIQPEERASLEEGVRNFCLRNSGQGIVVLISDLMDKGGYQSALRYLLAQRMDIYIIHVLSREEMDPGIQGELRLVDCEDAEVAEVTASAPLLARYRETLNAFLEGAREFCTRRGMSYVLAPNEVAIEEFVAQYLRRQGLVR